MKDYSIEFVNDAHYGEMRSDNRDAQKILERYNYNLISPFPIKKKRPLKTDYINKGRGKDSKP